MLMASMLNGLTINFAVKDVMGGPGFRLMSPLGVKRRRVRLKVETAFGV